MNQLVESVEVFHVTQPDTDPRKVPVRFSNLRSMARSPAHYLHAVRHGVEETLAMRLGSGAHAMLLGKPWTVFTGKVRNGKVWDAFEAQHSGAVILNTREYEQAKGMAEAVKSHPFAAQLLAECELERTIRWRNELQDRECQSTPDGFNRSKLIELKATRDSSPERFVRDGKFRMYHAQLAFYEDALLRAGLADIEERYTIAVESAAPHVVTVFRVTPGAIELGRRATRVWFERLLVCEAFNRWPGYVEDVVDFDVQDDEDLALRIEGEEVEL